MPQQRTSTRTNITEARAKLAAAHKEGRHPSNKVQNCPECEKAKGSTTKAAGNGRQTRKGVTPPPFREVTLVSETYLSIKGLGEDFDLVSCPRCAALLPSGERAETAHRAFHEVIDGLDQRS
jgi:hypothetical protein